MSGMMSEKKPKKPASSVKGSLKPSSSNIDDENWTKKLLIIRLLWTKSDDPLLKIASIICVIFSLESWTWCVTIKASSNQDTMSL